MRFFNRAMTGLVLFAITFVFLAAAAAVIYQSRSDDGAAGFAGQQRERIFAITVIPVNRTDVRPELQAFGEIRSGKTLELRAAASGSLVALSDNFVEGGVIRAGEQLFQTDPASAEAGLALAKTELAEALSEQEEAAEALLIAEEELAASERQMELRAQALARQKNLRERGVGTDAALESAELALAGAETTMLAKRQALANARARINAAKTNLARRDINANEAARKLTDLSVIADFDGVLANVRAVRGGLVNANEKLGDLIDPSALEVAFQISARDFADFSQGDGGLEANEVLVSFTGLENPVPAKITRVAASVGEGQTGREVFATLTGPTEALRMGDFVTVTMRGETLPFAAMIPSTAANAAGEVLVLGEGDRLRAEPISLIRKQGDDLIIRPRGLVGERIVKRRIPQIGEGIKIAPRDDVAPVLQAEEMVTLTAEEQAAMTAQIEGAPIPADRKKRILERIASGQLTKSAYDRIKSRMGG